MREIKFRAWFKKGFMKYGIHDSHLWESAIFENKHHQDDIELMQYTGLKDKNGVEIYEGDVVRWQSWLNKPVKEGEVGVIEWHRDGKWTIKGNYINNPAGIYSKIEVIGNIYENKELLNEN